MKRILIQAAMLVMAFAATLNAQILTPITWDVSTEMTSETEGVVKFAATIEKGWHLYGTTLPEGGPRETSIKFDRIEGAELIGSPEPSIAPVEKVDMVFHLKLNWW